MKPSRSSSVTSLAHASPAPPPTAPPCTTEITGFGNGRDRDESPKVATLRLLAALPAHIRAGAEVFAVGTQHNHTNYWVGSQCSQMTNEFVEHRLVDRIASIGPIEHDGRYATGDSDVSMV